MPAVNKPHDVERLDLPLAFGERPVFHRLVEGVASDRGLHVDGRPSTQERARR